MASKKQTAANRRNAQKSTGPITPEGKASSRFNALKHGIDAKQQVVFDESKEDLAHLDAEYRAQYLPANPTERFLVDTIVHNEWRLRRLRCVEAELWASEADKLLAWKQRKISGGETFAAGATSFLHVQRVINSCERNFHKALKELQRLKAVPPQAVEAEQSKPTSDFPQNEPNFPEATPVPAVPTPPDAPADPVVGAGHPRPSASDDGPSLPEAA